VRQWIILLNQVILDHSSKFSIAVSPHDSCDPRLLTSTRIIDEPGIEGDLLSYGRAHGEVDDSHDHFKVILPVIAWFPDDGFQEMLCIVSVQRDNQVRTRNPLYQVLHPVHLQLHGSCLGSVAGEAAPKKEADKSSIRGLTDRVFHSLNIKVCTFQSNFVALNGQ
jgi:hypothetical protein